MHLPHTIKPKVRPPQYAARLGVDVKKVLHWIETGELRAVNLATNPTGRPRWAIDEQDIEIFENRRAATPQPKIERRKQKQAAVKQYF